VHASVDTSRLELQPLPAAAAHALPGDREAAAFALGAQLAPDWPHRELHDVLPLQAGAQPDDEPFGIWVMIERETKTVVGDIGFLGPPRDDGTVEIGYSVVADRRRRGYATEAADALAAWALGDDRVHAIVAGCEKGNGASIRTLEKVGFWRTGETEGQLRWRLEPD